jgi:hypothetical protein
LTVIVTETARTDNRFSPSYRVKGSQRLLLHRPSADAGSGGISRATCRLPQTGPFRKDPSMHAVDASPLAAEELHRIDAYWRAADY